VLFLVVICFDRQYDLLVGCGGSVFTKIGIRLITGDFK